MVLSLVGHTTMWNGFEVGIVWHRIINRYCKSTIGGIIATPPPPTLHSYIHWWEGSCWCHCRYCFPSCSWRWRRWWEARAGRVQRLQSLIVTRICYYSLQSLNGRRVYLFVLGLQKCPLLEGGTLMKHRYAYILSYTDQCMYVWIKDAMPSLLVYTSKEV